MQFCFPLSLRLTFIEQALAILSIVLVYVWHTMSIGCYA